MSIGAAPRQPDLDSALVRLVYEGRTFCTGFVINQKERLVVTADHCMDRPYFEIDGVLAHEAFHVPEFDIAVVKAPGLLPTRLILSPRAEAPNGGSTVYLGGFAGGEELRVIKGRMLLPYVILAGKNLPATVVQPKVIPGMSGGVMVDDDSRVIALIQATFPESDIGFGLPAPVLQAILAPYWTY